MFREAKLLGEFYDGVDQTRFVKFLAGEFLGVAHG